MLKKRNGFALIMPILLLLLVSAIYAIVLNLSASMPKELSAQYNNEQAILYSKAYTEAAILFATANNPQDKLGHCAQEINGTIGDSPEIGQGYKINVSISYIGKNLSYPCSVLNPIHPIRDDLLYIIVDVSVSYKDNQIVDNLGAGENNQSIPWITYRRRTLQKL